MFKVMHTKTSLLPCQIYSSLMFLTFFLQSTSFTSPNSFKLLFRTGSDTRQEVIVDRLFTYKIITSHIHTLTTNIFHEVLLEH